MGRAETGHYTERLAAGQIARLMDGLADLVIELDRAGRVQEIHGAQAANLRGWVGQPFEAIVFSDSAEKARSLLEDVLTPVAPDSAAEIGGGRHVNLVVGTGQPMPFLLRTVRFGGAGQGVRLLLGRDLAPESRIQRQFQAAQQTLVRDYEARLAMIQDRYRREMEASSVEEAARHVGKSPLEVILAAFVQRLRRRCALEAVGQAREDYRHAAAILGISVEELDQILQAPVAE